MAPSPPDAILTDGPAGFSPGRRAAVSAVAALGCGWLGALFGLDVGYLLARLLKRDPAEIKDMLVWLSIGSPFVMAALGVWLTLAITGAGRTARTVALSFLLTLTASTVAMMGASYEWPKTSGTPIYDYELRLPTGVALSDYNLLDLSMWEEKDSNCCSTTGLRNINGRAQVSGQFWFRNGNSALTMSMRLREGTLHPHPEAYWRLPVPTADKVQTEFSPWQKLEFIVPPRVVPSVPPGDYEIRYRLKRFMQRG